MTATGAPKRFRNVPRASDELLLDMLWRRHRGQSTSKIAAAMGITQQEVSRRTKEVLEEDLVTPDPRASPDEIRRAYW